MISPSRITKTTQHSDQEGLSRLDGLAASVIVETQIRLIREDSSKGLFCEQYVAVTESEALDISVLSRDITGLFAAIVDQP